MQRVSPPNADNRSIIRASSRNRIGQIIHAVSPQNNLEAIPVLKIHYFSTNKEPKQELGRRRRSKRGVEA